MHRNDSKHQKQEGLIARNNFYV